MAALPYMQFYPSDYLSDTAHLSTLEHGAYLLLIFNYWQRGESFKAPDERTFNKRLAAVTRLSEQEWTDVRDALKEFFEVTNEEGIEWRHNRIEDDLKAVHDKSEAAKKAGQISGLRRKEQALNGRSPKAKRTVNHKDTDKIRQDKNNTPLTPQGDDGFDGFWSDYPKKAGKLDAQKAWAKLAPSETLAATIRTDVQKRSKSHEWTREGGQFVPYPATYLRGERWLDEVKHTPDVTPVRNARMVLQ